MKRLGLLVISAACLLSACHRGDQQTKGSAIDQNTKTTQQETKTREDQSSDRATDTQVDYNGSYYSVQGKYGEVIIVNKQHPLAPSYNPGEDATAAAAFWQLVADMREQGFAISDSYSGFRSYDYQASLYQSYADRDGEEAADRYSARPGYSEHQTGLAFDLTDGEGQLLQEPKASQWLTEHAHDYGFIVRYLPGKEEITGYMPESWHVRYIGQEAKAIYQSGLTLEEYFGVPGGDYPQSNE